MNEIILPVFFQQQTNDWYIDTIKNLQKKTLYNPDFGDINNIINNNKIIFSFTESVFKNKQLLYLIYSIFYNDNFQEPFGKDNDNGRPEKFEKYTFQSKHTGDSLGIYHAHVSNDDKDIIIWYFTQNVDEELTIHFKYMKHPSNYNKTLKEIYINYSKDDDKGINLDIGELFENTKYLLEEKILNYEEFINEKNHNI